MRCESPHPAFLITIDTEGDNLWAGPSQITTENSRWLGRFQILCERFGFKTTYLTDYEMALCPVFRALARDVLRRGAGELGAHLHAWNTPPIQPITENDHACGPYACEYPPELVRQKLGFLTRLLEDTFEVKMTSHRAGRWGFDGNSARVLTDLGYIVDSSITPGLSWESSPGKPQGSGGPDYTACPRQPYFVDFSDVRRPGDSPLMEIPATILPTSPRLVDALRRRLPSRGLLRRAVNRVFPPLTWLRPDGRNRNRMLRLLERARTERRPYVQFMLHSSELMPGASPAFPDASAIEKLYCDLEAVFTAVAGRFRPLGLTDFALEAAAGALRATSSETHVPHAT